MAALTGLVAAAALLLVAAGAAKVVDPSRTAGALRAVGWPASPLLVRAGALAETLLGLATLTFGGWFLPLLVGLSYGGFAVFVSVALRSGTPLATCGCFAQADTPPTGGHVALDAIFGGAAVLAALAGAPPLLEAWWVAWPVALAATVAGTAVLLGKGSRRA